MRTLKPWIWIAGGLLCAAIAGAGLLGGGPSLLGYSGAELYGHAWVQWWHGESLPGWPAGTELAVGADPWPVIDPLPTLLGALGGRLVGYTWSWNLLGLLAVTLDAVMGWVWLVLMMPFLIDTSVTLCLRVAAGHAPHVAHRDHAYQRLALRAGHPLPVTLGLLALQAVWQFPLAVTVSVSSV